MRWRTSHISKLVTIWRNLLETLVFDSPIMMFGTWRIVVASEHFVSRQCLLQHSFVTMLSYNFLSLALIKLPSPMLIYLWLLLTTLCTVQLYCLNTLSKEWLIQLILWTCTVENQQNKIIFTFSRGLYSLSSSTTQISLSRTTDIAREIGIIHNYEWMYC